MQPYLKMIQIRFAACSRVESYKQTVGFFLRIDLLVRVVAHLSSKALRSAFKPHKDACAR